MNLQEVRRLLYMIELITEFCEHLLSYVQNELRNSEGYPNPFSYDSLLQTVWQELYELNLLIQEIEEV